MKKTKIVCTIGPKSEQKEKMRQLVDAGMNIIRLNFSHGDFEEHGGRIRTVREIMKETGKTIGILLDTKGPEIRTIKLEGGQDVDLVAGQTFTITTDTTVIGNKDRVAVTYEHLPLDLKPGNIVLIDDGLIEMEVQEVSGKEIKCLVKNNGALGENKGVNLPNVSVSLPAISEKDAADLIFGCEQGVDFVAASFIRKKSDVLEMREHLEKHGGEHIKIISKIESQEGVDNFDEILAVSDAIMVARGDLGVEVPIEQVPFLQKMMIAKCNAAGKPVITATQMLDSMIKNPRPTRAESTDVANAILDGTDAVMLSGESAKGKYPVEAVTVMAKICELADKELVVDVESLECDATITGSVSKSAVEAANNLHAKVICVATRSGKTVMNIRKFFPEGKILAFTPNAKTAQQLTLVRGVEPITITEKFATTDDFYEFSEKYAQKHGFASKGDIVVVVAGVPLFKTGATNMMKVDIIR